MSGYANLDSGTSTDDVVDYSDQKANLSHYDAGIDLKTMTPAEVDATIDTHAIQVGMEEMGMGEGTSGANVDEEDAPISDLASATPNFNVDADMNDINFDDDEDDDDEMNKFERMVEMTDEHYNRITGGSSRLLPGHGGGIWNSKCFLVIFVLAVIGFAIKGGYEVFVPEHHCAATSQETANAPRLESKDDIREIYLSHSYLENLQNAAIATDNHICSTVGSTIMESGGGNAIDAAVASALCLGVTNMASSGIGGGAFVLVHDGETGENVFIDGREEAPSDATENMFVGGGGSGADEDKGKSSVDGPLAIGVFGELKALERVHDRFGKIAWRKVVEPARKLASDGCLVSALLAREIRDNEQKIRKGNAMLLSVLSRDGTRNGNLLVEGDLLVQTKLGETLSAIAAEGADAIYTGERSKKIADEIISAGGIIKAEDIRNYQVIEREPLIMSDVGGFSFVSAPPPSSGGGAVLGAIRFLGGYLEPLASGIGALSSHRLSEAMKHVFAMRMNLADPSFSEKTADVIDNFIKGSFMEELRSNLSSDMGIQALGTYGGKWSVLVDGAGAGNGGRELVRNFGYLEDRGTTHISVVDGVGNAVALTSTVNTEFGSKFMSPSTGILLNNQMDDFSNPGKANFFGLAPSEENYIRPGKRPLSSMSPTFVFGAGGKLRMVVGASGGPKIITATLQAILNNLWLGMDLFSAVVAPRIHDQLLYHGDIKCGVEDTGENLLRGGKVRNDEREIGALSKRGHDLVNIDYMGTVQAVVVDEEGGGMSAMSDIRKNGRPSGF